MAAKQKPTPRAQSKAYRPKEEFTFTASQYKEGAKPAPGMCRLGQESCPAFGVMHAHETGRKQPTVVLPEQWVCVYPGDVIVVMDAETFAEKFEKAK